MAKRKPVLPALADWSAVDRSLALMCRLEAKRQSLEARMTEGVERIRSEFQPRVEQALAEYAETAACVQQFCEANRADFGAAKSLERRHGTVSFRLSPPAVKPLNRNWTLKIAIEATMVRLRRFVRVKQELDKERVLADYAAKKVTDEQLAFVGLKIAQDETFGIELKTEDGPGV